MLWQRWFLQEGWGRRWGNNERKLCGLRKELGTEIPGSSSQEVFDNSRQMFLCPRFRLEARTQVQWASRIISTGGSQAAQPLGSGAGGAQVQSPLGTVLHSWETDVCTRLTANLPWRLLPNVEGSWIGGLGGWRLSWDSEGQTQTPEYGKMEAHQPQSSNKPVRCLSQRDNGP